MTLPQGYKLSIPYTLYRSPYGKVSSLTARVWYLSCNGQAVEITQYSRRDDYFVPTHYNGTGKYYKRFANAVKCAIRQLEITS